MAYRTLIGRKSSAPGPAPFSLRPDTKIYHAVPSIRTSILRLPSAAGVPLATPAWTSISLFYRPRKRYDPPVPLVRILVDGYSFLHGCPEIAPGQPRHSAAARDELIVRLTHYQDASGTPVTVIFDGAGTKPAPAEQPSPIEVLYSRAGQTADDIIERVTYRIRPYGDVLVVTDDFAERDTVSALGGLTSSCENFLRIMESAQADLQSDLKLLNRRENNRFKHRTS